MSDHGTRQRAWLVSSGRQRTVQIPVGVLAQLLDRQELADSLGPEMVRAIQRRTLSAGASYILPARKAAQR